MLLASLRRAGKGEFGDREASVYGNEGSRNWKRG